MVGLPLQLTLGVDVKHLGCDPMALGTPRPAPVIGVGGLFRIDRVSGLDAHPISGHRPIFLWKHIKVDGVPHDPKNCMNQTNGYIYS